ncbi:DUF5906 domain-containing protein [Variovorax sp. J22R133]|uniref:primase-helicase family protein n=1 Tax=Variovorax brevis TaxID=3053503 RepID=UPI002577CE33|nr:primase-helicase family protein [Variovorax sp. J22R133]MDM0116902.1 DUF5906 domain-containing protein [Variovorax sp. J22R133]
MPLTKSYSVDAKGALTKTPYPFVWEFTSHTRPCKNLADFDALLRAHAAKGHCFLKGSIARPLVAESRAGSTNSNDTTEVLVLDLDGLPEQHNGKPLTVDAFLKELGLGDVSYIVQWSAGHGIGSKKIRAHVFMLLDQAMPAPLLKQWLIQKNLEVPLLADALTLTKTGNTLSWPLDVSACQNDKLIYIAPPNLKGLKDPLAGRPRILPVKKKSDKLSLTSAVNSVERNRVLTHARITELRKAAGLAVKKVTYQVKHGQEVMNKPDEATITEMKAERGFVYFNLNGGDSWAYYHPENNPDVILNFKGEPGYLTKELLPDYWANISTKATRTSSSGLMYLAFCDRATSAYWRGTYNSATDLLDVYTARSETQLRDFAEDNGLRLGSFIPEWTMGFDPHDNVRVDLGNRTINTFQPSVYMKAPARKGRTLPKTIAKVIHNALGSDKAITEHFMNWLAFIVQQRDRTKTAWVLHGVPGTGKGIMMNNILRPLFSLHHTAARRMDEFNEKYNGFMSQSFIVFVDEVQTKALQNERGVMANLKNFITEEFITIREMYASPKEARNYTNWIFASNMSDPVSIDKDDRRFNVAKYQKAKLVISDAEIEQLEKELQAFHDYLSFYPLDIPKARTVLHTEDRDTMISISELSVDTVANALIEGNFGFFLEQLPADQSYERNALQKNKVEDYKDVLKTILTRTDTSNGSCSISREELRAMFEYVVGGMPSSPHKFTSLLKHHRMHLKVVWIPPKSVNGAKADWKDFKQFAKYQAEHFPVAAPPKALKPARHKKLAA